MFYNGIVKLFIVLIHDFSDFLSAFSLQLCLFIPDKFIQIRNMVISAYPKEMKFQNPSAIKSSAELENEPNMKSMPKYYRLNFDKQKMSQYISQLSSAMREKDRERAIKEVKSRLET